MRRLLAGRGVTVAAIGVLVALVAGGSYALAASGNKTITVCVKKHGGQLYKARKCKKHDSKLSWNQQGPAGKNGANGANGAPGAAGAPGATGKDGFVSMGNWQGSIGSIPAASTAFVFAGPTTTLTTNATQAVAGSGSAALATSATTANAEVSLCSQPQGGGTITPISQNTDAFEIVTVTTTRIPFAISQAGVPGAGTWNIGMCVQDLSNTQAIDQNDWSIGYAFVVNSSGGVTSATLKKLSSHAS